MTSPEAASAERGALLAASGHDLLADLAGEAPAPASGSAAALVGALAAALVAKAARNSRAWDDAGGAIAQAELLRSRLEELVQADSDAYEAALAALHLPHELAARDRNILLGTTLARAADVPLAIASAAADVSALADHVATSCEPGVRPDAVAAAALAAGAASGAAHLVRVNLATTGDDERAGRADAAASAAADASRQALAASTQNP